MLLLAGDRGDWARLSFGRESLASPLPITKAGAVTAGIRPEHLQLAREAAAGTFPAAVSAVELHGGHVYLELSANTAQFIAVRPAGEEYKAGEELWLGIQSAKIHLFEPDSGHELRCSKLSAMNSSLQNRPQSCNRVTGWTLWRRLHWNHFRRVILLHGLWQGSKEQKLKSMTVQFSVWGFVIQEISLVRGPSSSPAAAAIERMEITRLSRCFGFFA